MLLQTKPQLEAKSKFGIIAQREVNQDENMSKITLGAANPSLSLFHFYLFPFFGQVKLECFKHSSKPTITRLNSPFNPFIKRAD